MQRKQRTTKLITNLKTKYNKLVFKLKHSNLYIQAKPIIIKHERIFSTLLIILLFIPTILIIEPLLIHTEVEAAWYDTNWSFRERIPLTNTSGTDQTNWQTQITFDTSTPIAAGKMLSTCNDIRFTNNNGKLLPYWIEPGTCNSVSTKIWIKVDSIPNGGGNMYIYYGNPSASSANYKTSDVFIRDMTSSTATWPLDDTTSTQSYSRVVNPSISSGRNVINGTFDVDASWTKGTGWTIANGVGHSDGTGTSAILAQLGSVNSVLLGKVYSLTFTISGYVSGAVIPQAGGFSGTSVNANGTYTQSIVAGSSANGVGFLTNTTFVGNIDNVSVVQVNIPPYTGTATTLLTDGNMEAAGTSSWTAGNAATLSKQTTSPHGGSQVLRIARNTTNNPSATQTILTIGQVYRVYGYARSDGSATPRVGDNSGVIAFNGTASTTWQPFDAVFVAGGVNFTLQAITSTGTQYVEFDDIIVVPDTNLRPDTNILSTLDGDMEQVGTSYWSSINSATLSKQTTNPHGGAQVLRVARNGVNNPAASQTVLAPGRTYRVTAWVRSDGTSIPNITDSSGYFSINGSTSTSWQFIDIIALGIGTLQLKATSVTVDGQYAEFDDVTVQEVDPLIGKPTNGVTLGATANGHLTNAYSFDGTNDLVNIYSSDLNSVFNPNEGTAIVWAKVASSGVWTDGTSRRLVSLTVDGNNFVIVGKSSTSNTLDFRYSSGGVNSQPAPSTTSPTGWFMVALTWSKSNDQVKAYYNGAQTGSTITGLGTWSGNLLSTKAMIGINSTANDNPWSGLINDVHLYSRALSSSEISDLYGNGTTDRQAYTTSNYVGHELIAQTSSTLTVGTPAAEEVGSAPMLWYKLDDATGTIAKDSTSNANNATLGGTTIPTWQDETQCALIKCLYFDGNSSKITGSKVSSNIKTIAFWIRPLSSVASLGIMNLDGGTHKISTNSSGVITATGFTTPTYYINGYQTTNPTLTANIWNYVEITTNTSFNSTNSFTIGTDGTTFTSGYIDEVKFYNYVRTASQAQTDFNGVSSKIGAFKPYTWNSNLVASWLLQDSTSTQSYAAVTNPAISTGRNVVVNGTFDADANWTKGTGWTIASGVAHSDGTGSSANLTQTTTATDVVQGKAYTITFTVLNYVSGNIRANVGGAVGTGRAANGTYTETIIASSGTNVGLQTNTAFVGDIDNIIVTQVNIPSSSSTPAQLLADGDMETSGTAAWSALNSTLSKQTGTPHGGTQLLRATYNGSVNPSALQTVFTSGQVYRVYGYMRGDGTAAPTVLINGGLTIASGTTSTTWQPFDAVIVANGTQIRLLSSASSSGHYSEFDDVTVSLDTGIRSDSILSTLDGDMEQSGTSYWLKQGASVTYSKQTTSPHGGTQVLRVVSGGNGNDAVYQNVLVTGKTYRLTGFTRSDGTGTPRLFLGSNGTASSIAFTGTTSTSWQAIDITFISPGTSFAFNTGSSTNGVYTEWDDFTVTEIDPLSGLPTNGVTLGQSAGGHLTKAYSFDGTNDNVNIYSSDLNSAFNPSEGTVVAWAKVASSGVWTDGSIRTILVLRADSNNQLSLLRSSTNNQLTLSYTAGGTSSTVSTTAIGGSTNWFQVVLTWSKTNDQVKVYINGSQVGSTQTGLGTFTGNLTNGLNAIGAINNSPGAEPWSGLINDVNLYNRALTPNEISQIYNGANASSAGPVGYWKFDERTGTSVNDYSTNGNTGTWNGTLGSQWTTGKYGAAGNFNGSDNYVSTPRNSSLEPSSQVTVESWVNSPSFAASGRIVFRADSIGNAVYTLSTSGSTAVFTIRNSSATPLTVSSTTTLSTSTWYHLTGTYDGTTAKLYINGILNNSGSLSGPLEAYSTSNGVNIGANSTGSQLWNGKIDEVKIYNYARSPQQILEDMQGAPNATEISGSATSTKPNTAVGEWKFDEGYGTTANNSGSAGSSLNGTLTNMSSPATSTSGWQVASSNCKYNKCLAFDGSNDFISVSDGSTFGSNNFTVSGWFYNKTGGGLQAFLVDNWDDVSSGWLLQMLSNGAVRLVVNGQASTASTSTLAQNTWVHVAAVLTDTNIYIYVNGKLESTTVRTAGTITEANTTRIGCSQTTVNCFAGLMDDVKIYNFVLTSDEIKEEYNATSAINYGTGTTEGNNFTSGAGNAPIEDFEFEEGSGTTVNDSSGNAKTGTWNGTLGSQWTIGKYGKAGNFNGTDNYVLVGTVSASTNFTIEGWVNIGTANSGYRTIYANASKGFWLKNRQIVWFDGADRLIGNTTIGTGSWQHVAITYDGATLTAYLNGVSNGTASYSPTSLPTTSVGIGGHGAEYFNGKIDQVKIYNYVRTQDQIAYDYNRGFPVGWWKLDECQGTIAHDSSGNNNSGTITIGGTGTQTLAGNCNTSSTAWGNGATGKYNYSLNFDGTDDFVTITDTNNLYQLSGDLSFGGWFKSSSSATSQAIISKGTTNSWMYIMFINSGVIQCKIYQASSGVGYLFANSVQTVNDGKWHHGMCTVSGTTISTYIDGLLSKSSSSTSGTRATSTAGSLYIGNFFNSGNSLEFPGQIDDVRIYNYALTATQVKLLYDNGSAVFYGPSTGSP